MSYNFTVPCKTAMSETNFKYDCNTNMIHKTMSGFSLNLLRNFLVFVLSTLLHIGCVELNPGPSGVFDEDSSVSSVNDLSMTSGISELFSNSVSFLHLNIQSLAPKLELITAEYEDFDILSFSESWLNGNNTDDSIKLLNFQPPFRKDRSLNRLGGGIVVYGCGLCERKHNGMQALRLRTK